MTTAQFNTPMLKQYKEIKDEHQDAILFFRLGDFYEMFSDDAKVASKELELTLTGRGKDENRIPMCGVPYHAADNYIPRLVSRGYKVAICEQVEDASEAVGITRREVVQIITPGTVTGEGQLDDTENNYLCAVQLRKKGGYSCSYVDISTGEFRCFSLNTLSELQALIDRIQAKELIVNKEDGIELHTEALINTEYFESVSAASQELQRHFNISSMASFGLDGFEDSFPAAWAIISYVKLTQKSALSQLTKLAPIHTQNCLYMDTVTLKNLELTQSLHNQQHSTLFSILNHSKTSMGARLLKQYLNSPLLNVQDIEKRLDAVEAMKSDLLSREEIRETLKRIYDIERLIARLDQHNPRDLINIKESLKACADLTPILEHLDSEILTSFHAFFANFSNPDSVFNTMINLVEKAIVIDPPPSLKDGGVINDSYDKELDELKQSFYDIKDWIVNLEPNQREETRIKSLKVGFNKVFGYYIEVPNSQVQNVPESYIRKQTLTNAERYITPELKEKENILLHGEDKQKQLELELYRNIIFDIKSYIPALQNLAIHIATLDVLQSFATVSQKNNYHRPKFKDDTAQCFEIKNGRHPILEKNSDSDCISNDINLSESDTTFSLITGPNMAGKSTLMRQVALTVVMAQIGCFVPADSCTMSIVDKLFTRIGALDNLYLGQSTYMVEMIETATILHTATSKSLIILDEIGRGTATFDGMSIAWSITEYIHNMIQARTLFATHYHELTILEKELKKLQNFNMKITEYADSIIFNYKFIPGAADKSYGVHVAKMAGLPQPIIDKATMLLEKFEEEGLGYLKDKPSSNQLSLF